MFSEIERALPRSEEMRLLVISEVHHWQRGGSWVGYGPVVRELDALSGMFGEVVHLGFQGSGEPPAIASPYESGAVRVVAVRPAGGHGLKEKLRVLARVPSWIQEIRRQLARADVVFVRAPAGISLVAILVLALSSAAVKRWVKYAGNWQRSKGEPMTFAVQRLLARWNVHRGTVSVNGRWPRQPNWVWSFENPSFHEAELAVARRAVSGKGLTLPLRLVFAGRVEKAKGVDRLLEICSLVQERGVDFLLEIVGDGPEREGLQRQARELGLADRVVFHGWVAQKELGRFFKPAHFFLLPSRSEGWPKVLSEAMAWGVVPLASDVGSIPQVLESFELGPALPQAGVVEWAERLVDSLGVPKRWSGDSAKALVAAEKYTFETFLEKVSNMLGLDPRRERPRVLAGGAVTASERDHWVPPGSLR